MTTKGYANATSLIVQVSLTRITIDLPTIFWSRATMNHWDLDRRIAMAADLVRRALLDQAHQVHGTDLRDSETPP